MHFSAGIPVQFGRHKKTKKNLKKHLHFRKTYDNMEKL